MIRTLNKIKAIADIVAEHADEIPFEIRSAIAIAILDLTVTLYKESTDEQETGDPPEPADSEVGEG